MDEIIKDVRKGGVKEFLYANNLVQLEDSWEEVEMRYTRWKKAMTEKGLEVDVKKTKGFCTDKKTFKFLCLVS